MAAGRDRWLILPDPDLERDGEGIPADRSERFLRTLYRSRAEEAILEAARLEENPDIIYELGCAYNALRHYGHAAEAVIDRHEAKDRSEPFRLLHRQLAGMAQQVSAFASSKPEVLCGAFKARQINAVLRPLKVLLQEDELNAGNHALTFVSESGENTYSDVLFLLRNYLDVCADFAHRHFDGRPPELPSMRQPFSTRLLELMILDFCMDEPRGILEIGETLGYRDKKTVRKYLNPLLASGCLARTVPDKPCSRNQRYITVKYQA